MPAMLFSIVFYDVGMCHAEFVTALELGHVLQNVLLWNEHIQFFVGLIAKKVDDFFNGRRPETFWSSVRVANAATDVD